MTEEKRYYYSELKDGTYGIFKDKYGISFSMRLCEVTNEEQARTIVGQLNGLVDENEQLKKESDDLKSTLAYRNNQLALLEQLVDDLGSEEMGRQMDVILK